MATTTPNYGWSVPTSSDYVAQGAVAIETLGDSVDSTLFTALGGAYPGLRLVKKQTVGSSVSSVAVTSAFSTTYKNYKIIMTGGVCSTTTDMLFSLSGITSGYFTRLQYGSFVNTNVQAVNTGTSAQWSWAGGGNTAGQAMDFNLFNPFEARPKWVTSTFIKFDNGDVGMTNGYNNSTTSSTGFTITVGSGTITGGTIYVYGYGAS